MASPQVVPAETVTTDAKPHGQQQLAHDVEVERAVMGQRCRPQKFGEVQRCNPLCFLLTAAQYRCSWASLTDQLVRKFKDGLGINTTMKKFFIFVPVQAMKIFFVIVVSSGDANLVRIPTSNIFFLIFRLMRYTDICFFSHPGVLFTRE